MGSRHHLTGGHSAMPEVRFRPKADIRGSSDFRHWLSYPVHECPPQPFDRPEAIPAQPPFAQNDLRSVNTDAEHKGGRRAHPAELAEPVAEENESENERLQDVVGERHAPN